MPLRRRRGRWYARRVIRRFRFSPVLLAAALAVACFGPASRPGAEDGDGRRGGGPQQGQARGAGGAAIAYTLYGEGDDMLVLLHGWGGNQGQWSSQVDDLAQRYTVVTLDFGSHGASARRSSTSLAALAEDLEAVLAAVEAKGAILAGHGLGGLVALAVAQEKPLAVRGVIGVEAFRDPPLAPAAWQETIASLEADFPGGCRGYVRGLFAMTTEELLVDENAEEICHLDPAAGIALLRDEARFDLGRALSALPPGLPVRSIVGLPEAPPDEAPEVSATAPAAPPAETQQRFHANFKQGVIYRCGHYPMLEQSAELTRQLAAFAQEMVKR